MIGFFNHAQSPFPPFIECIMWFAFLGLAIGLCILGVKAAGKISKTVDDLTK